MRCGAGGAAGVRHRLDAQDVVPWFGIVADDNHIIDARGNIAPQTKAALAARTETVVIEREQSRVAVIQPANSIVGPNRVCSDIGGGGQVQLEDIHVVAGFDKPGYRGSQRHGRGRGEGVAVVVSRLSCDDVCAQDETEGDQEEKRARR